LFLKRGEMLASSDLYSHKIAYHNLASSAETFASSARETLCVKFTYHDI